jgi:hypothetical protein
LEWENRIAIHLGVWALVVLWFFRTHGLCRTPSDFSVIPLDYCNLGRGVHSTVQARPYHLYQNHDRLMSDDQLYRWWQFLVCFRRNETIEGRGRQSDSRPKRKKKIFLKRALSRLGPIKGRSMKPEGDIFGIYFCAYGSFFVCRKECTINASLRPLGKHAHRLLHDIVEALAPPLSPS